LKRTRRTPWLGPWLVTVGLLAACGPSPRRAQIASAGATGCEPAAIDVSQLRGGTQGSSWIARCGDVHFQCSSVPDAAVSCTPVRSRARAADGAVEVAPREASRGQGPRFQFARRGETLHGVRATFRTETATLTFTFTPEQSRELVQLTLEPPEPGASLSCESLVVSADGSTLFDAPIQDGAAQLPRASLLAAMQAHALTMRFCGTEWVPDSADVRGFEQLARHMDEALAAAPGEPAATPSTTLAVGSAEAIRAVREHLEAQRALLRGCAGVPRDGVLSVEATWDATGVMSVTVRGQTDSAVNECAGNALRDHRAPLGVAGRLIHVLPAD
jgi:hypothetical protein